MISKTKRKETLRQIVHLLSGIVGILNLKYSFVDLSSLTILLVLLFNILIAINLINFPRFIQRYISLFEREKGLKGQGIFSLFTAYYVLHFLTILFPEIQSSTLASMAVLTYGDSASTLFGVLVKSPKLQFNIKKSWSGLLSGIIFGAAAASIFIPIFLAILVSTVAMSLESLDLKLKDLKIDDNLLIPAVSLVLILLIQHIF